MAAPAIGERLGKYLIEAELGRGGMGIVYRARHVSLDRTVALKIVLSGLAPEAEDLNRFRREAQAIARLNHPNIVQVFDIEESHELTYLVMEFVAGENLDGLLKRTTISVTRMARIAADVAGALHFAHTKGVLHRDVKPANVLLSDERQVKVADFGLAYLLDTEKGYTKTGILVGSPHYMSPEQCQGKKLDGRSDLYSLGVVLFRMLTGRLPFQAASSIHVLMKQISDPPPDPKELAPEAPEELVAIIRRAMAKKPEDRFADMRGMRNALLEYLGEPPDDVKPGTETRTLRTSPGGAKVESVSGAITVGLESGSAPPQPASDPRQRREPAVEVVTAGTEILASEPSDGTEIIAAPIPLGATPRPPATTPRPGPADRPPEPARPVAPAPAQEPTVAPVPARKAAPPRRSVPAAAPPQAPRSSVVPWLLAVLIAVAAGVLASRYVLTAGKPAEATVTPVVQIPVAAGPPPAPASAAPVLEPTVGPTVGPGPTTVPPIGAGTAIAPAPPEAPTPVPVPTAAPTPAPAIAVATTAPTPVPTAVSTRRSTEQTVDLPFQGDRKRPAGAGTFCFTESAQRHSFPTDAKKIDSASIQMRYEIDPAEPVVGDRVVVRALVSNGSATDFRVDRFEESDPAGAVPPSGLALVKNVAPGQTLELRRFTVELKANSDVRRTLKVFDGEQGVWTRSFQVAPCR